MSLIRSKNWFVVVVPLLFLLSGLVLVDSTGKQHIHHRRHRHPHVGGIIHELRGGAISPKRSGTPPNQVKGGRSVTNPSNKGGQRQLANSKNIPTAGHGNNDGSNHAHELMSAPTAIANVLADLCPHGMLPIAYGMAAAGGTGPVLATTILLIFGALSWYSLVSFARAAEAVIVQAGDTDAGESLSAVWERTIPNGKATRYVPDLGCVLLTVGCLLFYSAFLGDIFGSLVSGFSFLPSILRKRWTVLLILHAAPILPLCLTKDLSGLKYSSMTGLVGIVYTVFFVAKRLVDGSYATGGKFHDLMPTHLQPAPLANFAHDPNSRTLAGYLTDIPLFHAGKGLLILMNMCCVAYACHYNAVKYYMELKDRTVSNLQFVMCTGLGGTAFVFVCMMLLGFASFGGHSQALLLNHYHGSQDIMASVARGFTGIAIISGYALMFAGMKAALFSLLELDKPNVAKREMKQNTMSVLLLTAIAIGACFVTEEELATVINLVGSVIGSIVIYIFPALINNNLLKLKDKKGSALAKPFFAGEAVFNNAMIVFGVVFAILGTWISLSTQGH